jgi:hypothetical protein
MKVKYKIKEVYPQVFCITFKDQYDLCMAFFRWSEFYESGNKKIRNRKVKYHDLMKEYSLRLGKGQFSYPTDWGGFNVPGWVFDKIDPLEIVPKYDSMNHYDFVMGGIIDIVRHRVQKKYNQDNFYLIGIAEKYDGKELKSTSLMNHETSHGIYYINKQYAKEMQALIKTIPEKKLKRFHKVLKAYGYATHVYEDEIAAYMATGLTTDMKFMKASKDLRKKFKAVYRKYRDAKKA